MNNLSKITDTKMTQYAYYCEKVNTNYIITIIEHNNGYIEVWTNAQDYGVADYVVGITKDPEHDEIAILLNAAIEYIEREA